MMSFIQLDLKNKYSEKDEIEVEYIHLNFLRKNKEDSEFSKYLYY